MGTSNSHSVLAPAVTWVGEPDTSLHTSLPYFWVRLYYREVLLCNHGWALQTEVLIVLN